MTIDEIMGEGDSVAVRLTWSGTFTGKFQDNEPNGANLVNKEAWFFHFKDGKDTGPIPYGNVDRVLKQMGVNPTN